MIQNHSRRRFASGLGIFAIVTLLAIGATLTHPEPAAAVMTSGSGPVYDGHNRLIGTISASSGRATVMDRNNRRLGHVDDNGTYNASGRKIASMRLPGLLLCGQ